jgi:transposase
MERSRPSMLGHNESEPMLFQMVDLEALVPANHRLRKIDRVLDLSFVRETVADCYSAVRGRPGVDPELAVRMMLLGELYDLSDRELCDEIAMHAGMRWFCRLNFHDPVPDHSTLSRLRNERWASSGLWDRLRDEVIRQCCEIGLVSGRHLSVDGTEMEADASIKTLKPRGPVSVDD